MTTEQFGSGTTPVKSDTIRTLLVKEVLATTAGGGGGSGALGPFTGSGSPEGVVTAPPGSIYTDITGSVVIAQYTKATGVGNTGWS